MRTVIYSIEKRNIRSKSFGEDRLPVEPLPIINATVEKSCGWSDMERDLIKAYFSHTSMIALGKKGSKVVDPIVHLDLLTRDLLFIVEMDERINDPKVPDTLLRLSKELAKYFELIKGLSLLL
jgi:hypothetical protein